MEARDWTSVNSSLASKSLDPSLVSKTVDGRFPSKISLDISNNSDPNHRTALRVESAEAGYGRNKVMSTYQVSIWAFSWLRLKFHQQTHQHEFQRNSTLSLFPPALFQLGACVPFSLLSRWNWDQISDFRFSVVSP